MPRDLVAWASRRDRQRQLDARLPVGLVKQRQHALGHSADISATAVRAADSSTIAFLAANAEINDGDGEVVDQSREAAGGAVDQGDRVVGEQRVGAAREREVVLHVALGLLRV